MPFNNPQGKEFYFRDPRLEMSQVGRLFVRLIFYSSYLILTAAMAIFLLSDVASLRWAGVLLLLFLLDRAKNFGRADKSVHGRFSGKNNLALYFAPATFHILEYAFERSVWTGGNFYLFLVKRLADRREIRRGLAKMDINPDEFEEKIEDYLEANLRSSSAGLAKERRRDLSEKIEVLARIAFDQAVSGKDRSIDPADLFGALSYCKDNDITRLFQLFNVDPGDLQNALIFGRFQWFRNFLRYVPATLGGFAHRPYLVRHRIMNRAWSARPTPTLDKFSEDLTDYARLEKVGFLIGHQKEYERMLDILSRPARPNVLLVGDPGSGKEALVAHLAFDMIKDNVPGELFDRRLVKLSIGGLVSGAEQGELQSRIKIIVEEILRAGNIVLYIPDIHNLAKTSGRSQLNAADTLLPLITSSNLSVIGATYPREYKRLLESQVDFASAFEIVRVEEVTEEEAAKILVYQSLILEKQCRVSISYGAVKKSVALSHKYFRDRLLPASAEDLLKEALADAKGRGDKALTADDILDVAQKRVNIPLRQAGDAEAEKLLNLEALIHNRLIDQEEAVRAVSRALREYRSGLARKGGPIASFLFVGPTGVGKTELSKILADIQFGSKEAMVRFDMSEFQDKQSLFRFIGSPDGSSDGALTEAVFQKPYSLILLDEFEKAHPDILNLFLQVFDDGRLTDNAGKVADFQNTIIIATSNAHSDFIKSELENGRNMKNVSEELKKRLTSIFRPELINRFSGIIVFKNLSPEDIRAICRLQLNEIAEGLKKNQGIEIRFSDEAADQIAEWGFDPVFGARPLRGVISDQVRSVLAEKILKKEISRGSSVVVTLESGALNFNPKPNDF